MIKHTHIKEDGVCKHMVLRYLQAVGQWVDDIAEAATDEEDLLALCLQDL